MTAPTKRGGARLQPTLVFTIPEAATELRLHRSTVYELISDGELEAIDVARPGSKRTHLRVPLESIQAYIRNRPRVIPGSAS